MPLTLIAELVIPLDVTPVPETVTADAFERSEPAIVTETLVPCVPDDGVTDVMLGAAVPACS